MSLQFLKIILIYLVKMGNGCGGRRKSVVPVTPVLS